MHSIMLSFKYRIKDATTGKRLDRYARACNQVWNYCVSTQREAQRRWASGMNVPWPGAFDLIRLCTGSSADLGIHSHTVQTICRQFVAVRTRHRRCPRFRASFGPKRALGWVPFIWQCLKINDEHVVYLKNKFHFWKSRDLRGVVKAGCFTQDARGRWYIVFQCEVDESLPIGTSDIGIDLGLKTLATCSDGTTVPALRHYRKYERALAVAQRARNKRRVAAIHAKIANARRHHLHEQSTRIARANALIVVGNVNAAKLIKTRMAKSVLDVSWSAFRNQLRYKASRHGARYIEANERLTSQLCSDCGAVGGPKGIAQLGIRHWICASCGTSHDRDVNAARNILRAGLERQAPAEGIPSL